MAGPSLRLSADDDEDDVHGAATTDMASPRPTEQHRCRLPPQTSSFALQLATEHSAVSSLAAVF
jgi:hypothetical protein